jgi:N-acetylmuramoyl-L-alanine amidase
MSFLYKPLRQFHCKVTADGVQKYKYGVYFYPAECKIILIFLILLIIGFPFIREVIWQQLLKGMLFAAFALFCIDRLYPEEVKARKAVHFPAKKEHVMKRNYISFLCVIAAWVIFPDAAGLMASTTQDVRSLRTVVIDPGHGGMDPGAVSGGVQEKDIVLDLALRLGNKIRSTYPEVKVIYTRDKDVFIPLYKRADIANQNKADIFISLHANYVSSPSAGGTETFTLGLHRSQENLEVAKKENAVILLEENYSENYEGFNPGEAESYIMFENLQSEYQGQSIDFAAQIQNMFRQNLQLNDRGVKQAGFLVLRRASMPSVLVEVGFISNPNERKFLVSESGKEKVTESIFEAFRNYKKAIDDRSRFIMAADDTSPRPVADATVQNTGNSSPAPPATTTANTRPAPPVKNNPGAASQKWYGVQVAAMQKEIPTVAANFKGEKNVVRLKAGNINKYVAGNFGSFAEALRERNRLRSKFPDAFVVEVENGLPKAVKK